VGNLLPANLPDVNLIEKNTPNSTPYVVKKKFDPLLYNLPNRSKVTLFIISILLCIVLFDFALIGILPKYFKIWPALDSSIGKRLIEESSMFSK